MAKGLLVLAEMPENCLDCELADCRYISNAENPKMPYGIYCTAKEWKIADSWLDLNVNDKRPNWCPLKELPESYELPEWITEDDIDRYSGDREQEVAYFLGYSDGWNECLDEIKQ